MAEGKPVVRITIVKRPWVGWDGRLVPASTVVREFADSVIAANWLVYDSYFSEDYTESVTWERLDTRARGASTT